MVNHQLYFVIAVYLPYHQRMDSGALSPCKDKEGGHPVDEMDNCPNSGYPAAVTGGKRQSVA
jgi:hypothetical protein